MFQNTFRKLYSCFVVVLRSFPQSFASGAPVVGVCTVVTKYAQRTIFIVPGVKNDLKLCVNHQFITPSLYDQIAKPIFITDILRPVGGRGGSYFPYILLSEIQTMLSQLAKRSARVLPADLCTDHAHYVKTHRSTVLRKSMVVEGGTVSHCYIVVIRKFIDFMSLFRHSVWFSFSLKQFPSAEFGI